MVGDQGPWRGHQCSKTSLTGDPSSSVSVGASPEHKLMSPRAGSERLTHWNTETVLWCENAGAPQLKTDESWKKMKLGGYHLCHVRKYIEKLNQKRGSGCWRERRKRKYASQLWEKKGQAYSIVKNAGRKSSLKYRQVKKLLHLHFTVPRNVCFARRKFSKFLERSVRPIASNLDFPGLGGGGRVFKFTRKKVLKLYNTNNF